jgi:hypothetical protein
MDAFARKFHSLLSEIFWGNYGLLSCDFKLKERQIFLLQYAILVVGLIGCAFGFSSLGQCHFRCHSSILISSTWGKSAEATVSLIPDILDALFYLPTSLAFLISLLEFSYIYEDISPPGYFSRMAQRS